MKCAKCGYLGFETGDRCRNCGFDFSLLAAPPHAAARHDEPGPPRSATPDAPEWLAHLDRTLGSAQVTPAERALDVQGLLDRTLPDAAADAGVADGPPDDEGRSGDPAADDVAADGDTADDGPLPALDEPAPLPPTPVVFPGLAARPAAARTGDGLGFGAPVVDGDDVVGDLSLKTPEIPLRASPRPAAAAGGARPRGQALPLFGLPDSDEPPPQLRAGPRPPIAVRRTPEAARVRALAREIVPPADEDAPALQFADPDEVAPAAAPLAAGVPGLPAAAASKRMLAAVVDAAVLGTLALAVVALTLRMLDQPLAAWRLLPMGPMAGFLGLLAFAYLCTFTAVGGQTMGKMAAGTRVVARDGRPVGLATAMRRAAASLVSAATLGAGFAPALVGDARLALHDRLAGTRVVDASR